MKRTNRINRSRNLAVTVSVAVLAMMLGDGSALADSEVNESGPASAKGLVYIENLAGSIKVKGWDNNEIEVTGTLDEKAKELNFETGGSKCIVEVIYPRRVKNIEEGSHLVIMVPRGSSLEIECVSADIEVSGVEGDVQAETVSGDVEIVGPCRSANVDVISGDVTVENSGDSVEIECISGRVRVTGRKAGVSVESVSGDVYLDFEVFRNLAVESVSGSIEVSGDLDSSGSFNLDVHSGSITLTVPSDVSADFEANTFNGDIETDFGHAGSRTSKYLPGQELDFSVGGGGADVEINTFSGNINIRKK